MRMIIKRAATIFPLLIIVFFLRNLFLAESISEVWEEYVNIVSDPAHVMAELTFIIIEAAFIAPIVAFIVARHDAKHHGHSDHSDCN